MACIDLRASPPPARVCWHSSRTRILRYPTLEEVPSTQSSSVAWERDNFQYSATHNRRVHCRLKSTSLSLDRIGSITDAGCQVTSPQSHINPPNTLGGCSNHGLYSSAGTSLASERLVRYLVIHWERRRIILIPVASRSPPLILTCLAFFCFSGSRRCADDTRYKTVT